MHRNLVALAALPLLVLPAACATPEASAAPQLPSTVTPSPGDSYYWPGQEEVTAAGETVHNHATRRWPDAYAGVASDLPGRALEVYRIPTPGFDSGIRKLTSVTVRFVDARHSARTVDGWVDRISADLNYWQRRGVTIHGVVSETGQKVTVEVDSPQRDAAKIIAHYPDMDLDVQQGWPAVPLTAP